MPNQILEIILMLSAFVAVLWLAQYATKKFAGAQMGKQRGKAMQIVEAIYVSPGKMLQIIEVGERYFLIAVYKEGVSFLTELSQEDIKKRAEQINPAESSPFADYLSKLKEKAGHKNEK